MGILAKKNRDTASQIKKGLDRYRCLKQHQADQKCFRDCLYQVQLWQTARMRKTHAELLRNPRYGAATEFFLTDVYGGVDHSELARQIERALGKAMRVLPDNVMDTAACALEFNALSGELDEQLTDYLMLNPDLMVDSEIVLDEASYCEGLRNSSTLAQREQQAQLAKQLAEGMDRYVRSKMLYATFKMLKGSAHRAGVGQLYDFMGKGFAALSPMGSASEVVTQIVDKEFRLAQRVFAGEEPYAVSE